RPERARQMTLPTPPGAVEEIVKQDAQVPHTSSAHTTARLTILLHASTIVPKHSSMQTEDVQRLADSLASVINGLGVQSVKLVAFNLDQGAVVFQKDA